MATIPAGGDAYGDISSDPGRRNKTQKFDTSFGDTELTVGEETITVNEARAAMADAAIAARAVTPTSFGLATRVDAE